MNIPIDMPAAFIGHGSPMNTLEVNRYTATWRALGRALPTPRAILCVSAHWFINGTAVTAMPTPRVIHDFYGFPKELFDFDYPASGAPDVADEIVEVVKPAVISKDSDSWGIDHGTWSVLAHMFPHANVPVVQLSVHAGEGIPFHIDLGARLAPLRKRGIFIVGSGNVVHNLRRIDWNLRDEAYDWAVGFDNEVRKVMTTHPAQLGRVESHESYSMCVPTPEHFLPLAYLAGLASEAGKPADILVEGGAMGSLTMTSFVLGCNEIKTDMKERAAARVPHPSNIPPEQTNT
jgi:4,5-DOPA dioxygenase extradiol